MQEYERRRSPGGKARRIAFRDLKRRQRSAGMAAVAPHGIDIADRERHPVDVYVNEVTVRRDQHG